MVLFGGMLSAIISMNTAFMLRQFKASIKIKVKLQVYLMEVFRLCNNPNYSLMKLTNAGYTFRVNFLPQSYLPFVS